MTKVGIRLDDLGELLSWADLRDFITHLPPTADSATFRNMHPKSWWWEPSFDFLSAMLISLQWANWQRGGGKGDKPKPIKRPDEAPKKGPKNSDELAARKRALKRRRKEVTG